MLKVRLYRVRTRTRPMRTRTRNFSNYAIHIEHDPAVQNRWNSLVIWRGTVQIECGRKREYIFVRANDRLDCPQSDFFFRSSRFFLYKMARTKQTQNEQQKLWYWEESCTAWQCRQRLLIKIVYVQIQYYDHLRVWLYLRPWFQMTKFSQQKRRAA